VVEGTADRRPPCLRWVRVYGLAILIFGVSVGGVEAYLAREGFEPSVPDSMELWYFWRNRIQPANQETIVLLGTSRLKADISLAAIQAQFPRHKIVQLAVSGAASSLGVAKQLIESSNFHGMIICELDTPLLDPALWNGALDYQDYSPMSLSGYCETIGRDWLFGRFRCLDADAASLRALCRRCLVDSGKVVGRDHASTFERETRMDFSKVLSAEALDLATTRSYERLYTAKPMPNWEAISKGIAGVSALARELRSRNGCLIFLRAPSAGRRWQLEEQYHPKSTNWDRFAATTEAICIHFRDYDDLRKFDCPDGSHLDFRDAPAFTRAFARHITEKVEQHVEGTKS
jgi:hypothetical protein